MLKNIEVTQDLLNYIYDHTTPLHPVQKDILNQIMEWLTANDRIKLKYQICPYFDHN